MCISGVPPAGRLLYYYYYDRIAFDTFPVVASDEYAEKQFVAQHLAPQSIAEHY